MLIVCIFKEIVFNNYILYYLLQVQKNLFENSHVGISRVSRISSSETFAFIFGFLYLITVPEIRPIRNLKNMGERAA